MTLELHCDLLQSSTLSWKRLTEFSFDFNPTIRWLILLNRSFHSSENVQYHKTIVRVSKLIKLNFLGYSFRGDMFLEFFFRLLIGWISLML